MDDNETKKDFEEEITVDESGLDDSVVAEENLAEMVKKLRTKLKLCEEEKQKYLSGWQRDKADFINGRKRDAEDREKYLKLATESLMLELVDVVGHFEQAFSNKEAWEKADKNWRIGIEYIYNHLVKILKDNGLEEIDPTGETFDPTRDEAVESIPTNDKKDDHKVIFVAGKGYKLNGKIIKPARVKIGVFDKKE